MFNFNGVKLDKYELLEHIEAIILTEKSFIRKLEWDKFQTSVMFINMFGKCVGKVYVGDDSPVELMYDLSGYLLGDRNEAYYGEEY